MCSSQQVARTIHAIPIAAIDSGYHIGLHRHFLFNEQDY